MSYSVPTPPASRASAAMRRESFRVGSSFECGRAVPRLTMRSLPADMYMRRTSSTTLGSRAAAGGRLTGGSGTGGRRSSRT